MFGNKRNAHVSALRRALGRGHLSLFLGSGVSAKNGLPSWENLVLGMFYDAIPPQDLRGWRPYPNYLFAIAEWHLSKARDPSTLSLVKYGSTINRISNFSRASTTCYMQVTSIKMVFPSNGWWEQNFDWQIHRLH